MSEVNTLVSYLGENSYYGVIGKIQNKITGAKEKLDSVQAKTLFENYEQRIKQSLIPFHEIKEFKTNAEQLAVRDSTVKEVLDFVNKTTEAGDYNFLVNIAKEEHFQNVHRSGLPNVEQTIESIKTEFNQPSSIIVDAIKNGIFDNLESNLLMEIKTDLNSSKNKVTAPKTEVTNLFESTNTTANLFNNDLVMYTPVGLKFEDVKNSRIVFLVENDVMAFNRASNLLEPFTKEESVDFVKNSLNPNHVALMESINSLNFDPFKNELGLKQQWDFNLKISKKGDCFVNDNLIQKSEVKNLLLESIQHYVNTGKLSNAGTIALYETDADHFINVMNNHKNLVSFNNLRTIRNLNESDTYVTLSIENKQPIVLASPNGGYKCDSFNQLFESVSDMLNIKNIKQAEPIVKLFESQIIDENIHQIQIDEQIKQLVTEQKVLNENISKLQNVQKLADPDTPAYENVTQKIQEYKQQLDDNINQITNLQNVIQ